MSTPSVRRRAALAALLVAGPAWVQAWAQVAEPGDPAECRRIASIRIQRLDVFDTSLPEENKALYRAANALHVDSRESTLRQLLLFKVGDPFDARLLQETERLMRATGYLRDATIRPVACPDGDAEIVVVAQDVWTLKPGVSFSRKGGHNSTSVELEDSNLFGSGSRLSLTNKSDADRRTRLLSYRDPLLGSQRLDLAADLAHNSDGELAALSLQRPFYALDTRWAAGISGRRETRIDSAYEQGEVVGRYATRDRYGRVFAGVSDGLRDGWTSRWTVGWTHDEHVATPLPMAGLPPGAPADLRLSYPWVGLELVQDEFRETRNLDQIGRTEDLALGWHVAAQLGISSPSLGSDRNATVFELTLGKGLQPEPDQTLRFDGHAKGRIEADGFKGTLFSGTARYYLRQSPRRGFFLSLAADRAINPDPDQQVLLGGDSGLRGYPMRYQSGKGRWVLSAEQRWFTDWYPFRLFNVGGAVFYDMGRAWDQDGRTQLPQGLLRDVGVGLRLGNSRSSLGNVVHIDLAAPLDGDPSLKRVQLHVETKRSF